MVKKLILSLTVCLAVTAKAQGVYVPHDGQIPVKVLQTTDVKPIHEIYTTPFTIHGYSSIGSLDLDDIKGSHPYKGVGVSLTDASCWWISRMPAGKRAEFLKDAFTKEGMNLSLIRLNCGASDYATELYNYDDVAGDVNMEHFSVSRDERYMIPVIKEVQALRPDIYTYQTPSIVDDDAPFQYPTATPDPNVTATPTPAPTPSKPVPEAAWIEDK